MQLPSTGEDRVQGYREPGTTLVGVSKAAWYLHGMEGEVKGVRTATDYWTASLWALQGDQYACLHQGPVCMCTCTCSGDPYVGLWVKKSDIGIVFIRDKHSTAPPPSDKIQLQN